MACCSGSGCGGPDEVPAARVGVDCAAGWTTTERRTGEERTTLESGSCTAGIRVTATRGAVAGARATACGAGMRTICG